MPSLYERLWAKIQKDPDGCWLWQGSTLDGYGSIWLGGGKTGLVHRLVWEEGHGPIPEGMMVLHSCDVRNCVRHLFLGTAKTNSEDMVKKGRAPRGLHHGLKKHPERVARGYQLPQTKVSGEALKLLQEMRAQKRPVKEVADAFGISESQVYRLSRRFV